MQRPCLECGALTNRTRCAGCEAARQRKRNASPSRQRLYDPDWQQHSRERREEQPWCTRCKAVADLTVDHPSDMVLCRRCHGELEAERRARRRTA